MSSAVTLECGEILGSQAVQHGRPGCQWDGLDENRHGLPGGRRVNERVRRVQPTGTVTGNTFQAGNLLLDLNDGRPAAPVPMFSVTSLQPTSSTVTRCIVVTNAGTVTINSLKL
jgi:hypothetical protein